MLRALLRWRVAVLVAAVLVALCAEALGRCMLMCCWCPWFVAAAACAGAQVGVLVCRLAVAGSP
jgi:hypothetical protein